MISESEAVRLLARVALANNALCLIRLCPDEADALRAFADSPAEKPAPEARISTGEGKPHWLDNRDIASKPAPATVTVEDVRQNMGMALRRKGWLYGADEAADICAEEAMRLLGEVRRA